MKNYPHNEANQKAKEEGIRFYSSAEEQELAYLKEGIKRTHEERFLYLMKLMKMQRSMQGAKFIDK